MHEQPVLMALLDADPAEYLIFLAPWSQKRDGPERLDDYLNGARRFLPTVSDGAAKIINRDQILWIAVDGFVDSGGDYDLTVVQKLAILELVDGSRLEGYLDMNRPADRQRLSDVLNDDGERFVRLTDDNRTYFVNKDYVRIAVPR
jgi:hypothetical protein